MTRAFLYLYLTSARNALAQRIRRLRQPKYLAGAVVGAFYLYLVAFRHLIHGTAAAPPAPLAAVLPVLEPVGALVLLVIVVGSWFFANSRAALAFTEAEAAFLFPAPLSRRALINAKLLRSQFGIFLSAFFLGLVFRRGGLAGGGALTRATGWWVVLSTLNLHFLATSFARERLLHFGLNPARRRIAVGAVAAAIAAAAWFTVRQRVPLPTADDLGGLSAVTHYLSRVLEQPPVAWILLPFRAVIRPYFAPDTGAFLAALGPALVILAAHYLWVVSSSVAFEEASIDLAARRAERIAALRAGRWRTRRDLPRKPRPEPFALRPHGWRPLAFLWKNLIALGPLFRFRTWAAAVVVAVVLLTRLGADPAKLALLRGIGAMALMASIWVFLFGPMFMRREVQQTLTQMDLIRSFPLGGWQVVVGQLLTPVVLLVLGEWFLLLVAALCLGAGPRPPFAAGAAGLAGLTVVLPPLCGLMLCIPYAGVLFFPAWAQSSGPRGGGIEVMGQRVIFLAGYLVVVGLAVLPAAAVGGLGYFIVSQLVGPAAAIVTGAAGAAAIVFAEFAGAVWWLGQRVERFDLSTELPR